MRGDSQYEGETMQIDLETLKRDITKKEVLEFEQRFPEIQKWLMLKGVKTKEKYIRHLIRYSEILYKNGIITEKSPNGLLELARHQTEEDKPHIENLEEFQASTEQILEENQRWIIFNISITVKSFYNFKTYTFPRFRASYGYSPREKTKSLTLDLIVQKINSTKNIRTKTILALETSCPIRLESLLFLKWRHFKEALENKELPMIKLEASELKGKGKSRYVGVKQICFLTPYSKKHILQYKDFYETRIGRKITLEDTESLEMPFLISDQGKPLTYSGLSTSLERIKTEAFPFRIHVFRTFVNDTLDKKAGMSKESRDIILGHKLSNVERAYTDPNTLREAFRSAVKFLDPEYKEDEKILRIKQKVKELRNVEISDKEAREILDTVIMKFFGND